MAAKRCPVIIDGVECGLPIEEYTAEVDLFLQIFRCALGHRSYAAPPEVNLDLNPISFGVVEFKRKPTAETGIFGLLARNGRPMISFHPKIPAGHTRFAMNA